MPNKQTLFSGIQPTGELHIGNYLGALKQWVELQDKYDSLFCVVDYHSLTEDFEPGEKREQILNTAMDVLAAGIEPEKAIFFVQSHVPEHTELTWIFNCLVPIAELERMTQFKDKAKMQKKNVNMGLFDYPVLMASDILLYKAEVVPVGEDQVQHIELTRKIAKKFNNKFGDYFKEPEAKLTRAARIMSLTEPAKKMSKSMGPKSYIGLSDSADTIREKISKAVTDVGGAKGKAGGRNLLDLFCALVDDQGITQKFEEDYKRGELKYSKLKPMLSNILISSLKPIQARRKELENNRDYVLEFLGKGAEQARERAKKTMAEVKKLVGIL
jgi:tryptophanyl-tRNA synthetase